MTILKCTSKSRLQNPIPRNQSFPVDILLYHVEEIVSLFLC